MRAGATKVAGRDIPLIQLLKLQTWTELQEGEPTDWGPWDTLGGHRQRRDAHGARSMP